MLSNINTIAKNHAALAWILPISAAWKTLSFIKNSSAFMPSEFIMRRVYFLVKNVGWAAFFCPPFEGNSFKFVLA